jgi:probable F420-dependent oxidoreductase
MGGRVQSGRPPDLPRRAGPESAPRAAAGYDLAMTNFGLLLRNTGPASSPEMIEAGAETAERLGWRSVWTTDHIMVPKTASVAVEYGRTFEAVETLAWVGARHPRLRLGTSIIVVPQRNAVLLAKELATLDVLSGGRVVAGVGLGWIEGEFAYLGATDRFHRRGAYLNETIRLWRHLWSGSTEPFHGEFNDLNDYLFGPLPAQGAALPILVGGSAEAALQRAGSLADGYQATGMAPDKLASLIPVVRAAAEAAGRPVPLISARAVVASQPDPRGRFTFSQDAAANLAIVRAYANLGVDEVLVGFEPNDPEGQVAAIERFDREVVKALAG